MSSVAEIMLKLPYLQLITVTGSLISEN